ncbi:hypothetical protein ACJX0J_029318 [Zea mays]
MAALGNTIPSYMNGWQYAGNCVLTLVPLAISMLQQGYLVDFYMNIWLHMTFCLLISILLKKYDSAPFTITIHFHTAVPQFFFKNISVYTLHTAFNDPIPICHDYHQHY